MPTHEELQSSDPQAHLTAAAHALRAWIYRQRGQWHADATDVPPIRPIPMVSVALPRPEIELASPPPVLAAIESPAEPVFEAALEPVVETVIELPIPQAAEVPTEVMFDPITASSETFDLRLFDDRLPVESLETDDPPVDAAGSAGGFREWVTGHARALTLVAAAAALVVFIATAGPSWSSLTDRWVRSTTSDGTAGTDRSAPTPVPVAADVAPARGTLHVESSPAGARVVLDGEERGVTPLTIPDLRTGVHTVTIASGSGSLTRRVNVEAGRTTELIEALFSGWVHVSTPLEVQITEGSRTLYLDEQNRVLLSPGNHELTFDNRDLNYREMRRVQVRPGETTQIVLTPSASSLSVTASEPAEVLVDGQRVGDTPLATFPVSIGTHDILVRSASGAERTFTMTVSTTPVQLDVIFPAP